MKKLLAALISLVAVSAEAQWDKTKPTTGSALVSADFRNNWAAIETGIGGVNLLGDPIFLIWAGGDTAAPTHWLTSGTVVRTGVGLADTNTKIGSISAKITNGVLYQYLWNTGDISSAVAAATFTGRHFSCGAWVRATLPSAARIRMTDGSATTYSTYHTGGSAWEWLTFTHTVGATPSIMQFGVETTASQSAHASGTTCVVGRVPPASYIPTPIHVGRERIFISGVQTVGTRKSGTDIFFSRATLIKGVALSVGVGIVAGTALIVDVNNYVGAFNSMFTTRPAIAAGAAYSASFVPDGTYRYRCFYPYVQSDPNTTLLSIDIDQIGSTTPGTDLYVWITYMQYERPLEPFLAVSGVV